MVVKATKRLGIMRVLLACAVLQMTVAHTTSAQMTSEALAAWEQGDYSTVMPLLQPLAHQGDANAQLVMGFMYANGLGIPPNNAEAVHWYRRAAKQGHASAQNELGLMYEFGRGVLQDYVAAHKWYNLAGARHSASEQQERDRAFSNRERVATKMTAAQTAEAQRLAREWQPRFEE